MGEQTGTNNSSGSQFDEEDLLSLHEDILEANEEGLRQLLREFIEDGLSLSTLCHLEAEIEPLADDHNINTLPLSAIHRSVLLDSTTILSLIVNCDPHLNINLPLKTNGFSPLHVASTVNNTAAVSYLASNGADVNITDNHGQTPVHVCAKFGFVDIAKILVVRGAELNVCDLKGNTPLHIASEAGNAKFVSFLLKKNVSVNVCNKDGQTPLHSSQIEGYCDTTSLLMSYGGDVNSQDVSGRTPVHFLIENAGSKQNSEFDKYQSCLSELLQSPRLKINIKDMSGNSALHTACTYNNLPAIQALLRKSDVEINSLNSTGAPPLAHATSIQCLKMLLQARNINILLKDAKGNSPLHRFAANDDVDAKMLVDIVKAGADVNIFNSHQETPLFLACRTGNIEKCDSLLKMGARLDILNKEQQTVLHCSLIYKQFPLAMHFMASGGINIDLQDESGSTALHYTLKFIDDSNINLVKHFIEKCANLNLPDNNGRLPADTAVSRGLMNILNLMISHGAKLTDLNNVNLLSYVHNADLLVVTKLLQQGMSSKLCNSSAESFLHLALKNDAVNLADALVKHGANCRVVDKTGNSPLHVAATFCQSPEIFRLLIFKGGNINLKNNLGCTPLHNAVLHNSLNTVDMFINELGAAIDLLDGQNPSVLHACAIEALKSEKRTPKTVNGNFVAKLNLLMSRMKKNESVINSQDAKGSTLLHYASELCASDIVQQLLEKSANVNVPDSCGRVPLHLAVLKGSRKIVEGLLKQGAEVNIVDSQGHAPLHNAVVSNHEDLVDILIAHSADVNCQRRSDKFSPLFLALMVGSPDMVETLLMHGADVTLRCKAGQSALHIAAEKADHQIVDLILDQKPDVHARDTSGSSPLHRSTKNRNVAVMKRLIRAGSDVDAVDRQGNTPLILTAELGSYDHASLLLENEADAAKQNKDGVCALHFATIHQGSDLVELLIANDADVDVLDVNGKSPLVWSLAHKNTEAALLLLDQGADTSVVDHKDENLLCLAVQLKEIPKNLVRVLVSKGCDFNRRNSRGYSALDLLRSRNDVDLDDLLQYLNITE